MSAEDGYAAFGFLLPTDRGGMGGLSLMSSEMLTEADYERLLSVLHTCRDAIVVDDLPVVEEATT